MPLTIHNVVHYSEDYIEVYNFISFRSALNKMYWLGLDLYKSIQSYNHMHNSTDELENYFLDWFHGHIWKEEYFNYDHFVQLDEVEASAVAESLCAFIAEYTDYRERLHITYGEIKG